MLANKVCVTLRLIDVNICTVYFKNLSIHGEVKAWASITLINVDI